MSKVMKSFICRGILNSVTTTGCAYVDIGAMLSVNGDADAAVEARI